MRTFFDLFPLGVIWVGLLTTFWNLVALSIDSVWPTNRVPLFVAVGSALLLIMTLPLVLLWWGVAAAVGMIPPMGLTYYTLRLCRKRSRHFVPHPNPTVDSWRILGGLAVAFLIVFVPIALSITLLLVLLSSSDDPF